MEKRHPDKDKQKCRQRCSYSCCCCCRCCGCQLGQIGLMEPSIYICVCVSLSVVCTSSVGPQHTEVIRFSLSLSRSACGMLPLDDEPMTLSNKQSNKDYQLSKQYYDMSQLSHTKTHTQLYLCICPSVCIELILFGGTRSRIVHVIVTIYPSTLKFYKLPYCTP